MEVGCGLRGWLQPRRSATASEVGSGLGGQQRPQRLAAVMFQCFCGLYIDVFDKCSQEKEKEEKEKEETKMEM